MPEPLDDPERIIAAAIERHSRGDVPALAATIVNELWQAGCEIRQRPDVIPIKGPRP